MGKVFAILTITFSLTFFTISGYGQIEQSRSISRVDYMKVKPGHVEDYLAVERVWKKIHQANIKKDMYQLWTVEEVISPSGDQYDYNYVTRISFKDPKQYSNFIDNAFSQVDLNSILSKEEMKIYNKTVDSRTLVKTEVWQLMDEMLDNDEEDKPWEYAKFNYFVINEGYTPDDFVEVQSIWSPVHEARIADDKLEGWVVLRKLMPYGSEFKERYATVDHYKSIEDLMLDDPTRYFDMLGNAEEANRKTEEGANLARQEIRRKIMTSSNSKTQ
ncbi:hypothetical protein [Portibacter marinus]|uniref:hypothetical protein n=1 Tax=Portibacter marinus TaxID=2898660 RepID=UPI001F2DAB84|nr:hypothetical protein [Portibacter marinus]